MYFLYLLSRKFSDIWTVCVYVVMQILLVNFAQNFFLSIVLNTIETQVIPLVSRFV